MKNIKKLLNQFTDTPYQEIAEYDDKFTCKVKDKGIFTPCPETLRQCFKSFPARDNISVTVTFYDEPTTATSVDLQTIDALCNKICFEKSQEEDGHPDPFTLEFTIFKGTDSDESVRSIYSLEEFTKYLSGLTLSQALNVFKNCLPNNNLAIFEVEDLTSRFSTETFYFVPRQNIADIGKIDRESIQKKRNQICNFTSFGQYDFIPEDFYFVKKSEYQTLNQLFDRLAMVFTLASVFNITTITNDTITTSISGYRTYNFKPLFKDLNTNTLDIYFSIYKWMYDGGNISDKAGLARNIITAYINTEISDIEICALSSIKSGYEIYLKENINNYIDIRNQIANKIIEISHYSSSVIDDLSSNFMKSIYAFLTFFISIIVITAIDNGHIINIFNKDITIISYGLISLSVIHLISSVINYQQKKERYLDRYASIKTMYSDLLDKNDLDRIFNKDNSHANDLKYLENQLVLYFWTWVAALFIIGIAVWFLASKCTPPH